MSADLHTLVAGRLRADGQRYTGGRRDLVSVLDGAGQPLTIPEIIERNGDLAQSSVYRNLVVLERARVVSKVITASDWSRYELAEDLTGHHHHLICSGCGEVRDIALPGPLERAIDIHVRTLADSTGYRIAEHRLDLVGWCRTCDHAEARP